MGYMPPVYGMNMMTPDQMEIQQRIQQMEQQRQQMQYPNQIPAQPAIPTQNVNWIYVAGVDGAKNQIVQPGNTAWMMDNRPYSSCFGAGGRGKRCGEGSREPLGFGGGGNGGNHAGRESL